MPSSPAQTLAIAASSSDMGAAAALPFASGAATGCDELSALAGAGVAGGGKGAPSCAKRLSNCALGEPSADINSRSVIAGFAAASRAISRKRMANACAVLAS